MIKAALVEDTLTSLIISSHSTIVGILRKIVRHIKSMEVPYSFYSPIATSSLAAESVLEVFSILRVFLLILIESLLPVMYVFFSF